MIFHIITIFPNIFDSYFKESILGRARKNKLIDIKIHNLRDFTTDKYKTVDDTPYGGGAGMVFKIEPIWRCVQSLKAKGKRQKEKLRTRVILFSAKGKRYTQADARRLAKYDDIIMICGRYEGVDERVAKHLADEEISIGEYVLTGGEIPAMVVADSITRLTPGALGNAASTEDESHSRKKYLEYPQYTKPADFEGWKAPEVLLGGNHKEIGEWREKHSKKLKLDK
jgi:tRNA (guanine37-N1)-methyltransferase